MPKRFIQCPVVIEGWLRLQAFIDTGSTGSLMSTTLFNESKLKLDSSHKAHLNTINGSAISIGRVHFQLNIASKTLPVVIDVVEGLPYPLLIGEDIGEQFKIVTDMETKKAYIKHGSRESSQHISQHNFNINTTLDTTSHSSLVSNQDSQITSLLQKYDSVFAESDKDLGNITVETHKIRTTHENPIFKPYMDGWTSTLATRLMWIYRLSKLVRTIYRIRLPLSVVVCLNRERKWQ